MGVSLDEVSGAPSVPGFYAVPPADLLQTAKALKDTARQLGFLMKNPALILNGLLPAIRTFATNFRVCSTSISKWRRL